GGEENKTASPSEFAHWRKQSDVLEDVSAFFFEDAVNYRGGDVVEQWQSVRASADAFRCLGIRIVRGRTFTPEEDLPHGPRVAVIGQGLWTQRFAGDPRILGKPVTLNDESYTVIGIVED